MLGGCRKEGLYEEPQTDTSYFCQFGKILVLRMDSGQVTGMAAKPSMAEQGRKHRHAQAQAMGIWRRLYTGQCCRREALAGADDN